MKWCLVFLCLVLSNLPTNGKEARKNARNTKHTCSGIGTACRCRQGRHFEQNVICTKENCMHKLPTAEIPRDQLRRVVSLVVTKQRNITSIGPTEIRRLGSIKEIRITRCNISRVAAQAFSGLIAVEKLDLHRNHLDRVPPAIKQLRNLKFLNLGGNRLKSIDHGAFFSLRKLQRLILGRNLLVKLPGLLPTSLVKITVSRNELSTLGNLEYLKNLKMLTADNNKLTAFPQLPHTVKIVSLCSNLIDEDISLQPFSNLTAINLSNNTNIGDITMSTFSSSYSRSAPLYLRIFEARNSGIRSVTPNAFKCLRRLRFVDISHNEIRQYQESWFSGNRALRSVHISGNPFSCDCDIGSSLAQITSTIHSEGKWSSKRKQMKNPAPSRSFHSDFSEVRCQNEGTNRSCYGFKFVDEACTESAYQRDAADKTTSTTTTTTTTATVTTRKDTTTIKLRPFTTSATTTKPPPITTVKSTSPATSVTTRKTTTFSTTPSITTFTIPTNPTISSTTTTTVSTTPSTTAATTTTQATTTTEPTTLSATTTKRTTFSTTPSTTASTTTAEATTSSTTTKTTTFSTTPSTTASTTTTEATTSSTTMAPTTRTTTPPPTTSSTTQARTTQSSTTSSTTTIVIPPIETPSSEDTVKWCLGDDTPCVFPFLYKGEEIWECLPAGWRSTWCASTNSYDENSDAWGYCKEC